MGSGYLKRPRFWLRSLYWWEGQLIAGDPNLQVSVRGKITVILQPAGKNAFWDWAYNSLTYDRAMRLIIRLYHREHEQPADASKEVTSTLWSKK